jgi:hypothetical protein
VLDGEIKNNVSSLQVIALVLNWQFCQFSEVVSAEKILQVRGASNVGV